MFQSELFNFPFISSVWGTASDWVMVIVTALTLFYIVKTFRSQLSVQKLQQEINKIEVAKFIQDQDLRFNCIVFNPEITSMGEENIVYIASAELKPINGNCKNIKITVCCDNGEIEFSSSQLPLNIKYLSMNEPTTLKVRDKILKTLLLEKEDIIRIDVEYENLLGNRFTQKFSHKFGMTTTYQLLREEPVHISS